MEMMTVSEARANLAQVVEHVRYAGQPVYLTRRNEPVAALVDARVFDRVVAHEKAKPVVETQSLSLTDRINSAVAADPMHDSLSFTRFAASQMVSRFDDEEW